jgi:hypothetical protein
MLVALNTHALIVTCLFVVRLPKKINNGMHKPALQLMQLAQKSLMRQIICLGNLAHARVAPVSHGHEITDMRNMRKVISNVANGVRDAFHLVVDTSNRCLKGDPLTRFTRSVPGCTSS